VALLRALLGRETRSSIETPSVPLTSATLVGLLTSGSSAGPMVTEASAHRVIAVYRAWSLIAGTIGSLPLQVYAGDAPGGALWTGPEAALLQFPGGRNEQTGIPWPGAVTAARFWSTVVVHLLAWGNAYIVKVPNAARTRIQSLDLLLPNHVKPEWTQRTAANPAGKRFIITDPNNRGEGDALAYPDTVMHVQGMGTSLLQGISPIGAARQALGLAVAAEEYGARLFANGTLASGYITTDQALEPDQATRLKERWQQRLTGMANAHDVAVLDAGGKFQQLTIPPEDSQFIESRKFQVVEIARLYGIPPHLLGDVEKSTSWGTGIAEQGIGFNTYALRPIEVNLEQALSNELLPRGVNCRFNPAALLQGSPTDEIKAHAEAINSGQETPNEARAARGLPPVIGADELMFPLNYGSLNNVANPPPVEPAPAQPALPGGAQ
jgi:HK97 family phage portal protein